MRFTWTGLILAPLLVPVMFSAVFVSFLNAGQAMGYMIGDDLRNWPTGVWTFQLWYSGKLLAEKNFTLSRHARAGGVKFRQIRRKFERAC